MDEVEPETVREFVEALVDKGLVRRDIRRLLALEKLLVAAQSEGWTREQLAAAVASLYATTQGRWELIERHFSEFLLANEQWLSGSSVCCALSCSKSSWDPSTKESMARCSSKTRKKKEKN